MPKLFVTGGAGFIGSNFIPMVLRQDDVQVLNADKLTYAGNLDSLREVEKNPRYRFVQADICDGLGISELVKGFQPDAVIHLAAESHVDRSIDGPAEFIQTNVVGTFSLLEAVRAYWRELLPQRRSSFRFLQVSTDEVFGSLGEQGFFHEESPYAPNSPYSASKAAADHLARAYCHTYGLPVLTTNCSNNFGPYQFPEKLIPLVIRNALTGKPLPVYGDGLQVRDWLHVEDHCRALLRVLDAGRPGESYMIGGRNETTNLAIVESICELLDELSPRPDGAAHAAAITFVADRPGHDRRYAVDTGKMERELGWRPQETFESGLRRTVQWYLGNPAWCDRVTSGKYHQERLGTET